MPQLHRLRDVDPFAIALCKKGANGQRIFLRKSEGEELVTIASEMPLHKSGKADWSTLYCIVAQPETQENGGMLSPDVVDVWDSPEEIRKAAHRLLKNRGYVNVEHSSEGKADAHIVESAVALTPIQLDDIIVPAGSWYVGIEPSADLRKAYDDGELTGVSLEGTGVREVVEVAKADDRKTLWERLGKALGVLDSRTIQVRSTTTTPRRTTWPTRTRTSPPRSRRSARRRVRPRLPSRGSIGTVNGLVDRLDKKNEKEKGEEKDDAPTADSIKKAVDELAVTVAERLDSIDTDIAKIAEGTSTQDDGPDAIKKTSTDPLAGIL